MSHKTEKQGYIALIMDVNKGATHLEPLSIIFDSGTSIKNYAAHRLNVRVTIVKQIVPVMVPVGVKLVHWGDED